MTEILLTDSMAEAGRKIFADNFKKMRKHEEGSRTGEDIESVHQMRVATRKMRSLFKLLGPYYQPKTTKQYAKQLRNIARVLGDIRDLDVLIEDLKAYQGTQDTSTQAVVASIIQKLDKRRRKNRILLNAFLDSKDYRKFLKQFKSFTKKNGIGAILVESNEQPYQVRHLLPILLHQYLAEVRAYETVLEGAEDETLHALRVEFKELRYAVEFFAPVLGTTAENFITEVRTMLDLLGRFNDISVFIESIRLFKRLTLDQQATIENYIDIRQQESDTLRTQFDNQWQSFNKRTVQRQFADMLLVLR